VIESEDLLVERSRQGDREAFEELVRGTARLVFARAYLEAGNVHRAEDLAQETFLLAWRSIGQVKETAKFRPWLLSILHRVVVDAARREGRKKRSWPARDAVAMERAADGAQGPEQNVEREEQRRNALAALRGLPEEYRQVLMLRYLAGADYETIGKQLAISNGSLRGLLNRGLAMLRSRLNEKQRL
jgi:RNA polymerase sigma-70 factor (ECF subfamily)